MEFASIRFFDYICTVKINYMENKDFDIKNGILEKYNGNEFHVVIPNSVTSINYFVFYDCTNISSIDIPNSVTYIGENAFDSCRNLTSIKIPNSVTYIGEEAFDGINKVIPQYNSNDTLRAFKAFNEDWTCRNFQYKVGKSYHEYGRIKCCKNGFHACINPLDIFNYYWGNLNKLHFAEVELSGDIDFDDDDSKVAAKDIRIIRELTVTELAEIYNSMEKL